jgi:hypothetical protein
LDSRIYQPFTHNGAGFVVIYGVRKPFRRPPVNLPT